MRACSRFWLALAIAVSLFAATLRAQFAYVANFGGNNVSAYSIGANGALTPVPGSPFAAGINPNSVAVNPTGKFAYVANFGGNNVSAYSIGANGALTPVQGSPFKAGIGPISVAVDPTDRFAYVVNDGSTNVSAYSIGANGALTPVPGSPFATGVFPVSVAVNPTGKFAYVAGSGVSAYSIGTNGALTPVRGSPFAGEGAFGGSSVAVDPTGKFAYVANSGRDTVSAYSIGTNGALTPVPGSPFRAGFITSSVAVDPTGKFAYAAIFRTNSGLSYSIGADGALTPVSPFATGVFPVSVAVDSTAHFVYVANEGFPPGRINGNVSAYSIGANGALTPVPGSPFAAGIDPQSVAITPLVPFASSFARLEIAQQGFVLGELFTLGAISNGINPLTQNLALQIGTFSVTIPPGSFKQIAFRIFVFQGVINGMDLSVQIVALGNNIFALAAESKGVNLTGLTNPVTVVLTIGNDTGSTAVTAQFLRERGGERNSDEGGKRED
jgi:6-phosphogluconolactonase